MEELYVYVIENDQPFINWYGRLKSYYPSSNFCEIEDGNEEIRKIKIDQVFEADSMKPINEILI